MIIFSLIALSCIASRFPLLIESEVTLEEHYSFPKDFSFGASTAAYQVEGGWKEDGKGPSIWDTLTHNHPELIADHLTADVGPDSYHFYKKDVESLKHVGVNKILIQLIRNFYFPMLSVSTLSLLNFMVKNIPTWVTNQSKGV